MRRATAHVARLERLHPRGAPVGALAFVVDVAAADIAEGLTELAPLEAERSIGADIGVLGDDEGAFADVLDGRLARCRCSRRRLGSS